MFLGNLIAQASGNTAGSSFTQTFGRIREPQGVAQYNNLARAGGGTIGILIFFSRFIQLVYVIAGLWVMFNFVTAGFIYLTAEGDSAAAGKVKNKVTMSVIGLIIIVASYGIISILSLLFFGSASFILNPILTGPVVGTP